MTQWIINHLILNNQDMIDILLGAIADIKNVKNNTTNEDIKRDCRFATHHLDNAINNLRVIKEKI